MEDLISIIVPIYNAENYLKECLDSLIKQTYTNLEIILINDGSDDDSLSICREYEKTDNRIVVIDKKNEGVSAARNDGLKISKGEWISFVDADDYVDLNFCEIMHKNAIAHNVNYVVCGYYRKYDDNLETVVRFDRDTIFNSNEYLLKILNVQNGFGFCHMKLIHKNVILEHRFDKDLKVGEDALFNMKISSRISKALYISKPLYYYRFNSNSVVRKFDEKYAKKYLDSMILAKEYLKNQFYDKKIKQGFYNYVSYHVLLILVNYCFNPSNKNNYRSMKDVLANELFKESIEYSNYDDLSITRKITLATLKYRLYSLTALICMFRQWQFNK